MPRVISRRLYATQPIPVKPAPVARTSALENARQKAVVITPDDYDPLLEVFTKGRSVFREARKGTHLHVSDLIHKCMRARALQAKFNMEPPPQQLTISDQFTFAQGDAIHDTAKEITARNAPTKAWGKWRCHCKYLRHDKPATLSEIQEETCPYCGTKVDIYEEVSIFNDKYDVVGNPDLIMFEPEFQAFHINEFKSMSAAMFKELVRPQPLHVLQVTAYWQLMKWAGYPLTDKVSIGYISKGWAFGSTLQGLVRTFTFKVAPELPRLRPLWEAAETYKAIRTDPSAPMPIRMCKTRDDTPAKTCNVCQICFSGAGA